MTQEQKNEIEHLLEEYTNLANKYWENGDDSPNHYWKGQVMGMCKVLDRVSDIDTSFYLKRLL